MDFDFTPEQQASRDEERAVLSETLPPISARTSGSSESQAGPQSSAAQQRDADRWRLRGLQSMAVEA